MTNKSVGGEKGMVLFLGNHFEALLVAAELMPFINSPMLPAGWQPSIAHPLTQSIANSHFILPYGVWSANLRVKSFLKIAAATESKVHLRAGDIIRYCKSGSDPITDGECSLGVVILIFMQRSTTAKAALTKRADSYVEACIQGNSKMTSAVKDELRMQSTESVDYFSRFAPTVRILVMDVTHLMGAKGGGSDIHQPSEAPFDRPVGVFTAIKCDQVISRTPDDKLSEYFEDGQQRTNIDIMQRGLPVDHLLWTCSYLEGLAENDSMIDNVFTVDDEMKSALMVQRAELEISTDQTMKPDYEDPLHNDLTQRAMTLSNFRGADIDRFMYLSQFVQCGRRMYRPANAAAAIASFKAQLEILDVVVSLSTEQKAGILQLYGHGAFLSRDAAGILIKDNVDAAWVTLFVQGADAKIPRTKLLLEQALKEKKRLDWTELVPEQKQSEQLRDRCVELGPSTVVDHLKEFNDRNKMIGDNRKNHKKPKYKNADSEARSKERLNLHAPSTARPMLGVPGVQPHGAFQSKGGTRLANDGHSDPASRSLRLQPVHVHASRLGGG